MGLTIRDVAKGAGVSTATVSNVLNKTGKVGPRTHRLVTLTVRRLGYFPNAQARHLASHRFLASMSYFCRVNAGKASVRRRRDRSTDIKNGA
ncbi:MAG: LacI family DNA-binding transcriptional regulator [Terriglobales bacterium]